jgi:hypothetical protein
MLSGPSLVILPKGWLDFLLLSRGEGFLPASGYHVKRPNRRAALRGQGPRAKGDCPNRCAFGEEQFAGKKVVVVW